MVGLPGSLPSSTLDANPDFGLLQRLPKSNANSLPGRNTFDCERATWLDPCEARPCHSDTLPSIIQIPWLEYPVVYDVRAKPRNIASLTGTKGGSWLSLQLAWEGGTD